MGMFDYVNVELACPKCGARMRTFQSNDGPCDGGRVEIESVRRFYDHCHQCKAWIQYVREELPPLARKKPATLADVMDAGFVEDLPA